MLFLHISYGTPEFPDCGNLEGTDWMEDRRWANSEPSMHFRETNTDPTVHFRKASTNPSMHFRKANTEFLVPALLPTLLTIPLPCFYLFLLPVLIPTLLSTQLLLKMLMYFRYIPMTKHYNTYSYDLTDIFQ